MATTTYNTDMTVIVACHKNDFWISDSNYYPIHVGKHNSNQSLDIAGDNTGDNISSLNPNFCELTGLYWAWKNLPDVKYIGLAHYRRYFDFNGTRRRWEDAKVYPASIARNHNFTIPDSKELFKDCDIILAEPRLYPYSIIEDYSIAHSRADFDILTEVINEKCPEMASGWFDYTQNNNLLSHYNMFIMSKENMDKYCQWLFDILFEVRNRVNIDKYTPTQARIFGYMSERMLHFWALHTNKKIRYCQIAWINDNPVPKFSSIRRLARRLKHQFAFYLTHRVKKHLPK